MFPSGYSNRQYGQSTSGRSLTLASTSSSAAGSSRQQNQSVGAGTSGQASGDTWVPETADGDNELMSLLLPPSPPPSLDQILSAHRSPGQSGTTLQMSSASSLYQGTYAPAGRETFVESSSSLQQPRSTQSTGLISRSSWQQSVASRLTSVSEVPGVRYQSYRRADGSEGGRWVAQYRVQRRSVFVGGYRTQEEAAQALQEHRLENGLPPVRRYFRHSSRRRGAT